MKAFYANDQTLHAPKWYLADGTVRPCPEVPARADILHQALAAAGMEILPADAADPQPAIRKIHAPDYLAYFENIHAAWMQEFGKDASEYIVPDTFPPRRSGPTERPTKPSAQTGYYCFDMAAPIGPHTFRAAIASAKCAVAAADSLLRGNPAAYALCRPPGHHAGPDYCGGFCFLNNSAVAAQHLLLHGKSRIALLDIDYHHGNGTQDIFYHRSDVLFVSIHADPNTQYPYFWGHAAEIGSGPGKGFNINLPLARGTGESAWLETLTVALAKITAFRPDALVISLGVDIAKQDTVGDFALTLPGFGEIGTRLAAMCLPTLFVQEGGYNLEAVGPCVVALLTAFDANK